MSDVRHLPVGLPQPWRNGGESWSTTAKAYPIRSSPSNFYVDPVPQFSVNEWPFRTTFALDDRSTWNMLEFCEDLTSQCQIEQLKQNQGGRGLSLF